MTRRDRVRPSTGSGRTEGTRNTARGELVEPRATAPKSRAERRKPFEGWHGWDDYAPFYDWENRQTMGRRDVQFWRDLARRHGGPVLELGCGTGRVSLPIARAGVPVVGVDRSDRMLLRLRQRLRRLKARPPLRVVRGDIRALPFLAPAPFALVMAPYGILQSLVDEHDLAATLRSVARVSAPGTIFGIDLVSDVPAWTEYKRRVRMRGRGPGGSQITLVESVRQQEEQRLTIFDQEYIERRGGRQRVKRFSLAFRTLPLPAMLGRVETAGFEIDAVLGDYDGRPWDLRADVWLILARKR